MMNLFTTEMVIRMTALGSGATIFIITQMVRQSDAEWQGRHIAKAYLILMIATFLFALTTTMLFGERAG